MHKVSSPKKCEGCVSAMDPAVELLASQIKQDVWILLRRRYLQGRLVTAGDIRESMQATIAGNDLSVGYDCTTETVYRNNRPHRKKRISKKWAKKYGAYPVIYIKARQRPTGITLVGELHKGVD